MAIIERHRDEISIQGGELPLILLPTNCPGCGTCYYVYFGNIPRD